MAENHIRVRRTKRRERPLARAPRLRELGPAGRVARGARDLWPKVRLEWQADRGLCRRIRRGVVRSFVPKAGERRGAADYSDSS